ncbi:hypothetical protein LB535_13865 [Mesorhizobium sp. CA10]|uniref:hypothetical protein n=1 Tax=Mesorhizobium sp. CA10 TaxID=588495 RepID=UPI001CCF30A0|nr:hypothetical protein [Mesorhizobium sp. CA10]MBZ9883441.1 hypothetical protein [Mesorhizobium sp. CA10]
MVDVHLGGGGTPDREILAAMRQIPREVLMDRATRNGRQGNQRPKAKNPSDADMGERSRIGTSKGTFKEPWRDTVEGDVKRLQHRGRHRPEAESSNNK